MGGPYGCAGSPHKAASAPAHREGGTRGPGGGAAADLTLEGGGGVGFEERGGRGAGPGEEPRARGRP